VPPAEEGDLAGAEAGFLGQFAGGGLVRGLALVDRAGGDFQQRLADGIANAVKAYREGR